MGRRGKGGRGKEGRKEGKGKEGRDEGGVPNSVRLW